MRPIRQMIFAWAWCRHGVARTTNVRPLTAAGRTDRRRGRHSRRGHGRAGVGHRPAHRSRHHRVGVLLPGDACSAKVPRSGQFPDAAPSSKRPGPAGRRCGVAAERRLNLAPDWSADSSTPSRWKSRSCSRGLRRTPPRDGALATTPSAHQGVAVRGFVPTGLTPSSPTRRLTQISIKGTGLKADFARAPAGPVGISSTW